VLSKLGVVAGTVLAVTGLTIVAATATASAATGLTGTVTLTPATGLTNGQTVTLTGSGFSHGAIGNILECNSDSAQPNVHLGGVVNSDVPVGCSAPSLMKLVTTTATGTMTGTFTIIEGTVGPPCGPSPAAVTCPATDAAGTSPTADAALYPCPPTAAEVAKGDTCQITYGDINNDSGVATINFAASTTPTTAAPTTTPTPAATTPTTKAPVVAAPTTVAPSTGASTAATSPPTAAPAPSTLAATGPGPAVGWLGAIGIVLLLLGLVLLFVIFEGPRRALVGIAAPAGRIRKLSLPVHRRPEGSITGQITATTSRSVGHFDQLGRRLGHRAAAAPAATRELTHRVASASVRTAAWLLGR
jgi:hypothetical protein